MDFRLKLPRDFTQGIAMISSVHIRVLPGDAFAFNRLGIPIVTLKINKINLLSDATTTLKLNMGWSPNIRSGRDQITTSKCFYVGSFRLITCRDS